MTVTERTSLRADIVPLAVMWVVILLGVAFLVDTPSVRVWMVVIAASVTLAVALRARVVARRA